MAQSPNGAVAPRLLRRALVAAVAALSPAVAQDAAPRVRAELVPPGEAPRIDGVLDDPLWSRLASSGASIRDFTQVEPVEGAPPSQPTEVRIAFDQDFLYVAFQCSDERSEVRARQMDRDANIQYDDVVELWLDPFGDARFAFWFQITPGGSRGDALIADGGSSFNKQWDGIWYGRSRVTDDGWEAELAIPFRTLSFDPEAREWGFNVTRKRVANGETQRWASPRIAQSFFTLAEGGRLVGLSGMHQGLGLDVVPYLKAGASRPDSSATEDSDFDLGLDVAWRPTPSSSVRLTFNTDFAETEVDARRVNLDRFPLFFPEKRDFFLEDAGVFEFGAPMLRRSVLPFFSRRVGRDSDGAAVPILAGGKLTGRFGAWSVGGLATQVDSTADVGEQGLGVMRVSRSLGDSQSIGAVVTAGDPNGGTNSAFGVDARLGSSRLFGPDHSGYLWAYALGSTAEGDGGDDSAFGVQAQARSSTWRHDIQLQRVGEEFDPALGFVRRRGIDRARWEASYTWRTDDATSLVRSYTARVAPTWTWDRIGREDGYAVPLRLMGLEFASEDRIELEVHRIGETIEDSFDIGDSATVAPGEYDMTRWFLELESNDRRLWLAELDLEYGDYFGGDIQRLQFSPQFVPNRYLALGLDYEDISIDLAGSDFHTELYGWRIDATFTPDLAWKNLFQYDTESKDLGLQSRLHWIVEPGQDLFIVAQLGFEKADHRASFVTRDQELVVKFSYTWRF